MRVLVALLILLFATSAQAATLQMSDVKTLNTLAHKLTTAQVDLSEAIKNAGELRNDVVVECLYMIHNQTSSFNGTAIPVSILVGLSVVMKDNTDELLVLRALRTFLDALSQGLIQARKQINAWMTRCGNSAVVNVKAQAVLNILSEFEGPIASLSRRVPQN
jgi:hypothetical protein